jgi:hypothetical protein
MTLTVETKAIALRIRLGAPAGGYCQSQNRLIQEAEAVSPPQPSLLGLARNQPLIYTLSLP